MNDAKPQPPQPIQPMPVPTTVSTMLATLDNGTKLLALQTCSFTGSHIAFLDDAQVRYLRDECDKFLSGIVRASSPLAQQLADAMIPINGRKPH